MHIYKLVTKRLQRGKEGRETYPTQSTVATWKVSRFRSRYKLHTATTVAVSTQYNTTHSCSICYDLFGSFTIINHYNKN